MCMVSSWNCKKIKYDFINILTPYCVVECSNCRGSFLLCKWSICLLEIGTKKSNFSRVHFMRLCLYFPFANSPFLSIPKQHSKKETQKVTNGNLLISSTFLWFVEKWVDFVQIKIFLLCKNYHISQNLESLAEFSNKKKWYDGITC